MPPLFCFLYSVVLLKKHRFFYMKKLYNTEKDGRKEDAEMEDKSYVVNNGGEPLNAPTKPKNQPKPTVKKGGDLRTKKGK